MSNKENTTFDKIIKLISALAALIAALGTIFQLSQSPGDSLSQSEDSDFKPNEVVHSPGGQSIPGNLSPFEVIKDGNKYWTKEGYYLVFGNNLRLWATDINPSQESAKVVITDDDNNVLASRNLNIGEDVRFIRGQRVFFITLTKVGRAGKNPFNRAAFFKVQRARINN